MISIVGATEWYERGIESGNLAAPEDDLVLGLYPLAFLTEVVRKTGAVFFAALLKDYKYLSKIVSLRELRLGKWKPRQDPTAIGQLFHLQTAERTWYLIQ